MELGPDSVYKIGAPAAEGAAGGVFYGEINLYKYPRRVFAHSFDGRRRCVGLGAFLELATFGDNRPRPTHSTHCDQDTDEDSALDLPDPSAHCRQCAKFKPRA